MNPVTLTLILCGLAAFCILTPIIGVNNARQAEAERQRQIQAEAEVVRKEAERKANDPAEIARRQREAQAATEMQAEIAKRGKRPIPSSWDAITPEANAYLKTHLKDYDSMKLVECSDVITWGENAWAQRVKYRAKNSFGGYVLEEQVFVIKDGRVIDVIEY